MQTNPLTSSRTTPQISVFVALLIKIFGGQELKVRKHIGIFVFELLPKISVWDFGGQANTGFLVMQAEYYLRAGAKSSVMS